jgi:uncharacterized membrane protein
MAVSTSRPSAVASRRARPHDRRAAVPWVFAVATVGAQIGYPLVDGEWLRRVTIASVVLFFLASLSHALVHRGLRWTLGLVVVTTGGGLLAEAVGVRTGLPFGDYTYSGSLGPQLLGVPVIVPLAWTMMAYPVLLAARHLTTRWWVVLVGGVGLAGWDVFLDPQMVNDGRWRWTHPTPALPGVEGVPLTNYAGWLVVGVVMMALLSRLAPRDRGSETVPAVLLTWTYLGSIVGNLFWFGEPSIALAGGLAMGLLVLPYLWSMWQSRP